MRENFTHAETDAPAEEKVQRKTSISLEYPYAFVLDESSARAIHEIIAQFCGSCDIKSDISDSAYIQFKDIDDFLSFPNLPNRHIVAVIFEGVNHRLEPVHSVSLSFTASEYNPVAVRMTGAETEVLFVRREIDEVIERCKLPHSKWAIRSGRNFVLDTATRSAHALVLCIPIYVGMDLAMNHYVRPTWPSSATQISYLFLGALGVIYVITFVSSHIPAKIQRNFFPLSVYSVGDGMRRWEVISQRRQSLKSIILYGVGLALAVSLGAALLYDILISP